MTTATMTPEIVDANREFINDGVGAALASGQDDFWYGNDRIDLNIYQGEDGRGRIDIYPVATGKDGFLYANTTGGPVARGVVISDPVGWAVDFASENAG